MDKIRLLSYKRKERKGKGIKKVRARRIEKEFSNECGIKYKTIWTGEKKRGKNRERESKSYHQISFQIDTDRIGIRFESKNGLEDYD